jgi:hypothetical protein
MALGREATAWRLLTGQPQQPEPATIDQLADLEEARWDLLERRAPPFEASANVLTVGSLATLEQRLSGAVAMRGSDGYLGVDVLARQLFQAGSWMRAAWPGNQYYAGAHVGFITDRWRGRLAGGMHGQGSWRAPTLRLDQELSLGRRLGLTLGAGWNELPTESDLLRATALRSSASLEGIWKITAQDRLTLGVMGHRFAARRGGLLAAGGGVKAAFEHELTLPWLTMAGRVDFEAQRNQLVRWLPARIGQALGPDVTPDDFLWTRFELPGVGLTLSRTAVASRRPYALRSAVDAWAGWLSPAGHLTYGAEAMLSLRLASHVVTLKGFHYADRGGSLIRRTQGWSGLLLNYSLGRL